MSGVKFVILVTVTVLSVAVAATVLCLAGDEAEFVAPPFESNAVLGTPSVPEDLGYSEVYRDGMGYRFSVCGNVTLDGNEAAIFLTNPEGSGIWLKLRVLDQNGSLLGETGLIKPGEYVEAVTLTGDLPVGTAVVLKIMGYEPETYHSVGAVSLRTSIGERLHLSK